jgi:hydrogenase assembly chaperone HypC/HupF
VSGNTGEDRRDYFRRYALGLVYVMGMRRRVDLGLLQEDKPKTGDWVLIHVGFAMSKISEEEALDQMHTLQMLGESEAATRLPIVIRSGRRFAARASVCYGRGGQAAKISDNFQQRGCCRDHQNGSRSGCGF